MFLKMGYIPIFYYKIIYLKRFQRKLYMSKVYLLNTSRNTYFLFVFAFVELVALDIFALFYFTAFHARNYFYFCVYF